MTLCIWSERVAMLLDGEDATARKHVVACAECAGLLAELQADRELLRSMPVPPMQVRLPRRHGLWAWPAALAASLAIGVWLWPQPAPVEPMAVAVKAPAAPSPELARRPAPVRRVPKPAAQTLSLAAALEAALPPHAAPPVAAKGDVVVAMQTEDPNVVIVLVGDSDD